MSEFIIRNNREFLKSKSKFTESDAFLVDHSNVSFDSTTAEKAQRETFRLASFQKCKIAVRPFDLAMTGFYYVGPGDRVRCYSCGTCVQSWKPSDIVDSPRWHTTNCKHYKDEDPRNVAIGDNAKPSNVFSSTKFQSNFAVPHSSLNLNTVMLQQKIAKNLSVPKFAIIFKPLHEKFLQNLSLNKEAERRKSFVGDWPEDLRTLIKDLAKTGFFYLGNSDRTQCFSCGAVQKNWVVKDDVRKIHGESFRKCKMIRGEEDRNVPILEQKQSMDLQSFLSRTEFSPSYIPSSPETSLPGSLEANIYDSPLDQAVNPRDVLSTPPSSYHYSFSDDQIKGPPPFQALNTSTSENSGFFKLANNEEQNLTTDFFSTNTTSITSLEHRNSSPILTGNLHDRGDVVIEESAFNFEQPTEPTAKFLTLQPSTSGLSSAHPNVTSSLSVSEQKLLSAAGSMRSETTMPMSLPSNTREHHISEVFVSSYPPAFTTATVQQTSESLTLNTTPSTLNVEELSQLHIPVSFSSTPQRGLFDQEEAEPSETQVTLLPDSELDVSDGFLDSDVKLLLKDMYPCDDPDNRSMVYLSQRLSSFQLPWPENNSLSTVTEAATAGFYYLGTSDHVRCWYCGVEAQKWAIQHHAWFIHARLFPSCQYLLRNRGSEFVEAILTQVLPTHSQSTPSYSSNNHSLSSANDFLSETSSNYDDPVESGPNRLPTPPIVDPRVEAEFKKSELRKSMESPMVKQALSMGFRKNHVRDVLIKQIEDHNCSFQSFEALLDALIFTPENLIDLSSSEDGNESNEQQAASSSRGGDIVVDELDDSIDLYHGSLPPEQTAREHEGTSELEGESKSESGVSSSELLSTTEKEAELRRLKNEKRCKVCLDQDATLVFVPCGHICACEQCCRSLKQCPLCRTKINKAYRTYPS